MLVIREEQLRSFHLETEFKAALEHIRKFFPDACAGMSTDGLSGFLVRSLNTAMSYGFRGADLLTFVDLALLFGEGFDCKLPWAQSVLALGNDTSRAPLRASRLFERGMGELRRAGKAQ